MRRVAALLAVAFVLAGAVLEAAPERVTRVLGELRGSAQPGGYVFTQGETEVETVQGRLPVVDYAGRRALEIHATMQPGGLWHVGISTPSWTKFALDDYGPEATLELDVAGSLQGETSISIVDVDKDAGGPDTGLMATLPLARYVQPTADWQHVGIPLGDFVAAAPALELDSMDKVVIEGRGQGGETTLYVATVLFRTTHPERTYPPVKVDQVGYPPAWRKLAKVSLPAPVLDGDRFVVKEAESGQVVHEGRLTVAVLGDGLSGDNVYDADFSALVAPGAYVVEVPGLGKSSAFRISQDVYEQLSRDVARFWFFQRCGMELDPQHAGPYAHRACHVFDEAVPDPQGGMRDCRGGWHDAGDMNRYAGWTVDCVSMLLTLYRHYPDSFPDGQLNLPESGNGLPDLLDEVKYELQWVRKMLIREGPEAGMVYDRIHEDRAQQPADVDFYDRRHGLSNPSDEAACALVADLSHAYMVYQRFPQERAFAEDCLKDALLSWNYLTTRGKPGEREFFTAAVFLFEATGRQDAHDVVKRLADGILNTWHGHLNYGVHNNAVAAYCLSERPEVDGALQARLRQYFQGYADAVVQASRSKGYNEPMIDGVVFSWGSNGHCIAKSGTNLLLVYRFSPKPEYLETARETLHWLLGRNAVNTCMVTGYGEPPLGPIYHSMFGPLGPGLPMPPGYLPGGVTAANCPGLSVYPAKCWRPDHTCWELTEPSLGYQGPFTYLVGALTAMSRT